jgi:hypothetical protein
MKLQKVNEDLEKKVSTIDDSYVAGNGDNFEGQKRFFFNINN